MSKIPSPSNCQLQNRRCVSMEMEIPNFRNLPHAEKDWLESTAFDASSSKWHLRIYPKASGNNPEFVSLYLYKETYVDTHAVVSFSIIIAGKVIKQDHSMFSSKTIGGFGLEEFIKRSELLDVMCRESSDVITVACTIHVLESSDVLVQRTQPTQTSANSIDSLSLDLERLYLKGSSWDWIIEVDEREFKVHEAIIAGRCKVLDRMLKSGMTETKTRKLKITGSDPDSVNAFILYLYNGKLDREACKNLFSLYKLAHLYEAMALIELCSASLIEELSIDTFCDVYQQMILYIECECKRQCDCELKSKIIDFFVKNAVEIMETEKWKVFSKEYDGIAHNLTMKLIKTLKN